MEWKDPPPIVNTGSRKQRRQSKYHKEAGELRSRPGEWGVVRTIAHDEYQSAVSFSTHIKNGDLSSFPEGDFESCVRTEGNIVRVYARYIGKEGSCAVLPIVKT